MGKMIIFAGTDGLVRQLNLAPHLLEDGNEDALAAAIADVIPADAERLEVDPSNPDHLPQDQTFRGAWVMRNGRVEVDMARARDIHLVNLRAARDKRLASLDVPHMSAISRSNMARAVEIEDRKQELRDLPLTIAPRLSAAQSPEELLLVNPF